MKINKDWHVVNKMPKNPTSAQRLAWHTEHAANCQCRPFTEDMKKKLTEALS